MNFALSLAASLFTVTAAVCPPHSVCRQVTVDGQKLLVVAGDGHLALMTDEAEPVVVARSEEIPSDIAQAIELHDFTGDGRPEFVARFVDGRDVLSWVFAFDRAGGLRLLSPSIDDDEPWLSNADILDVDGDGRSDIVTVSVVKEMDPTYRLYTYRDGRLRPAADREVFHYSAQTGTSDVHVPRQYDNFVDVTASAPPNCAVVVIVDQRTD